MVYSDMDTMELSKPIILDVNTNICSGSQYDIISFLLEWTIINISLVDIPILPDISANICIKSIWFQLQEHPFDVNSKNQRVQFKLDLSTLPNTDKIVTYQFFILYGNGNKIKGKLTVIHQKCEDTEIFLPITLDEMKLLQGKLTIFLKLGCVRNFATQLNNTVDLNVIDSKPIADFGYVFENEQFYDITLVVCEREFKAHKAVLAKRSSVFDAIFKSELVEPNRITLTDIKPEVFEEMLHFIYTGEAPNLKSMVHDLLAAADKYSIKKLIAVCVKDLSLDLNVETIFKTLILADLYRVEYLKVNAIRFICQNATAVMNGKCWKDMKLCHPQLVSGISDVISKLNLDYIFD